MKNQQTSSEQMTVEYIKKRLWDMYEDYTIVYDDVKDLVDRLDNLTVKTYTQEQVDSWNAMGQ